MRFFSFSILFSICIILNTGKATGLPPDDQKCQRSTEGTEFWFGFMQGRSSSSNHFVEITVSSRVGANFTVSVGKNSTVVYTGSVIANNAVQIRLNTAQVEPAVSESVLDMGIHISADNPVNVYAYNHDNNSSDVAVMYPVESIGNEYYAICYTPLVNTNPVSRNSEFVVVASQDNTLVTITPSNATDGLHAANTPFTVTLNKGELYQVQSLYNDLTGSYIASDKPVAVYAGSLTTIIPNPNVDASSKNGGHDHLYEQMPPIRTWGREYYTVPLATRSKDYFRVLASKDSTTVYIGNNKQLLRKGLYYEFTLNVATRIYADKPIIIAQYSQAKSVDGVSNGDNFMVMVNPVSQAKNDVTFVAYTSTYISKYYVNIVAPVSEIGNIELAGSIISASDFHFYSNGKYAYAQLPISAGAWRLRDLDEDRGFIAYVYGYGGNEAYGYGVGFNLDLILDIGQNINFEGDTLPMCKGTQVLLDAGPYFDQYLWNTGDTTQQITVNKEGNYWAIGKTIDGCERKDSIYVILAGKVKPDIGPDDGGCEPYSRILDPGPGFRTYDWNTGDTTQTLKTDKTGEYILTVSDRFWCITRDTMKFTVYPVPKIKMTSNPVVCGAKNLKIELQFSGMEDSLVFKGKMDWKTKNPANLFLSNKTNISADVLVNDWGSYEVFYKYTSADGCVVEDTLNLKFAETPTSKFNFIDDPNDKCKDYSRDIKYNGNATAGANFYWDFEGCISSKMSWNQYHITIPPYGSNALISLVVEENGCWSDTTTLLLGANPKFKMNTEKSRGCDTATIYFSGTLEVPDDLVYEWNFGDGSEINRRQNPVHFYADTGKYDVSLVITNILNGCQAGYKIDDMVKIFPTPTAKIEVDPATCTDSLVKAVYVFNIDSSICTWSFAGAYQVGSGNDSVMVFLDQPTGTIKLRVEEYGCKSTRVETVATRKPFFNMVAYPGEGCQPLQVTTSALSSDEGLLYTWLTDSVAAEGSEHLFLINSPGLTGFRLTARSGITGCSDTIFYPAMVEVDPKPEAMFKVDYPIAIIDNANLTFTNQTSDVTNYNWDFGDGSFSETENPQHRFVTVGKFAVTFMVQTQKGCRDTLVSEVEIVPFTTYTPNAFRPDSEIEENRLFMPITVGVDPNNFSLLIFNRWGEVVFESHNPENKWDGAVKNNKPAPVGNYVWKAEFLDVQGFSHSMKGQVLLIR